MMVLAGAALMAMAQAPTVQSDVAFEQLVRGQDAAAIEQINANDALEADDPARLINLGIAYERRGARPRRA